MSNRALPALLGLMLLTACKPAHRPPSLTLDATGAPATALGMPYLQARRLLLNSGFKPAQFGPSDAARQVPAVCDDFTGSRCRNYPELYNCEGAGTDPCEFDLVRTADGRVLLMETAGVVAPAVTQIRWATPPDLAGHVIANRQH